MAALSPALQILGRRLLAWDRARVAVAAGAGHDVTAYRQRQDLAEVALGADIEAWPGEVRDLFQAVLEVTRPVTPVHALQVGVGRLQMAAPPLSREGRIAYREFARETGVLDRLRKVDPVRWAEDGEEVA